MFSFDTIITLLVVFAAAFFLVKKFFFDRQCSGCSGSCQEGGSTGRTTLPDLSAERQGVSTAAGDGHDFADAPCCGSKCCGE